MDRTEEYEKAKAQASSRSYGSRAVDNLRYRMVANQQDWGRLIPGSYTYQSLNGVGQEVERTDVFYPYVSHFDSRHYRTIICSGGLHYMDRNLKQPCHGCDEFWDKMVPNPAKPGRKKVGYMGKNDGMVALTFLHYQVYHKAPQVDRKTGMVRVNPHTNEAYLEWQRCQGRGCKYCGNPKFQTSDGRRLYLPASPVEFKRLLAINNTLSSSCAVCGEDKLATEAWACPYCEEVYIDADTSLSDEDIDEAIKQQHVCRKCGKQMHLFEHLCCDNCGYGKDGAVVRRATIFDVDIQFHRVTANAEDKKGVVNIATSRVRPIPEKYAAMATPIDFLRLLAPTPLEEQAKIIGMNVEPAKSPFPGDTSNYDQPSDKQPAEDY